MRGEVVFFFFFLFSVERPARGLPRQSRFDGERSNNLTPLDVIELADLVQDLAPPY